jgi:hypothetical protein
VNPKTFMLIAVEIAAEQRAIVAHSASYGFGRPQIFPAPAGAEENHLDSPKNLSPHPGLKYFHQCFPTALAVGYCRTPLRGWKK